MNRSLLRFEKTRKWWTAIKVLGILALGLLLGILSAASFASVYKRSLVDRARTATQSVDIEQFNRLSGDDSDLQKPEYIAIKQKMYNLHQLNRDSRFVYIFAMKDDKIIFSVDSESPTSQGYSPPGEVYDDTGSGVRGVFANGRDIIEGPVRDRWGIWLSALAPIYDPNTQKLVGVLGIDVPARDYMTLLLIVAAFPITIALIASIIIGVVDVMRRREQERIEMQAELVSVITHELNNPLTGIRWGAELLLSSYYREGPGANVTQAIYSSVRKLQESVDDVLEITRLGRTTGQLNFEDVAMTPLIQDIFDTQKLPADHKGVSMVFESTWPLDLHIVCDANKMKRVFNNLISNAIKYTKDNTVVLVGYQHANGKHIITVKDQGIGIPKEEQAKVFAGFYRATNAIKSGERGTGMGLFLVRRTVQQHEGTIKMDSEEDKGTSVVMELPDNLVTGEITVKNE